MKNKWFKHYNTAHESDGFRNAFAADDHAVICIYWMILEHISKHENREIMWGYCAFHERYWCRLLETNVRGLETYFRKVNLYFGSSLQVTWSKLGPNMLQTLPKVSPEFVQFFTPKWLELQENRGGKRVSKTLVLDDRGKKREVRSKRGEGKELNQQADPSLIFDLWNEHRGSLSRAESFTEKRKKTSICRLKENPSKEYWMEIIKRISASSFCSGENDRGWKADLDFLLRPDTHIKVLEGKYDNKSSAGRMKIYKIENGDE